MRRFLRRVISLFRRRRADDEFTRKMGSHLALLEAIAGVGLFGVLSYTTSLRTREIGLRTALGARRVDVIGLVVRQAVTITAAGLVVGVIAALALSRSLSPLLYGVSAHDVLTFIGVPVLLTAVALLACLVPTWRASRINPIDALRMS